MKFKAKEIISETETGQKGDLCCVDSEGVEWRYTGDNRSFDQDGKLHRLNGPAVEHPDGAKEWWLNGVRHRSDGPAVEWANGEVAWWFQGVCYSNIGGWLNRLAKIDPSHAEDMKMVWANFA